MKISIINSSFLYPKLNYEKTLNFLLIRKKESGGFGATPFLPATIEDTYYATKALSLLSSGKLNQEIKVNLKNFLKDLSPEVFLDPVKAFQILKLYQLSKFTISQEILETFFNSLNSSYLSKKIPLKRLYSLWNLIIWLENNFNFNFEEIRNKILSILKTVQLKTLEDLYYFIDILRNFTKDWIDYIINSQNGDGGFGFYPGTTSYLENTYYALSTLNKVASKEVNFKKTISFVLACYNSDGGFSRKPGGISYLETTAMALEILFNFNVIK